MKILYCPNSVVLPDLTEEQRRRIVEAAGGECQIVVASGPEEQVQHAPDVDVVLGQLRREAFLAAKQLRWVQTLSAGVDAMMYPEFIDSDTMLASEKGLVGDQLADHAFGLLLGLTRGIAAHARRRSWVQDRAGFRTSLWELSGRTMGIVGLGGTGLAIARRAEGFGMRVIAVDPEDVEQPPYVAELWKTDRFRDLLAASDVVALGCPLTSATRNLFNIEAFQTMRRHAFLINVTRGEIVEEEALVQALREGLIAGAGLDVTPREPLPPDSPLWGMPNVIIGSHTAGASPFRSDRVVDRFCRNLRHWRAGEPLEGLIDKKKGY